MVSAIIWGHHLPPVPTVSPKRPPALARRRSPATRLPYARPHFTFPCVNSAPARAASCMRIRSAARSNSCLHLCEQKKYRRFLYSLQGVASPLSTAAPQMGSYDRPFVLLSPEFTCFFPALTRTGSVVLQAGRRTYRRGDARHAA